MQEEIRKMMKGFKQGNELKGLETGGRAVLKQQRLVLSRSRVLKSDKLTLVTT